MPDRRRVEQTQIWGPEGHPARGLAQARRTTKPMDRTTFHRQALRLEFGKVAARNGVDASLCEREDMVILDVLAHQLRLYCWAAHLIRPEILPGMTMGEVLDEAARLLVDEIERRRLSRLAGEAVRA